jgi:hypothetical protein
LLENVQPTLIEEMALYIIPFNNIHKSSLIFRTILTFNVGLQFMFIVLREKMVLKCMKCIKFKVLQNLEILF